MYQLVSCTCTLIKISKIYNFILSFKHVSVSFLVFNPIYHVKFQFYPIYNTIIFFCK